MHNLQACVAGRQTEHATLWVFGSYHCQQEELDKGLAHAMSSNELQDPAFGLPASVQIMAKNGLWHEEKCAQRPDYFFEWLYGTELPKID